MSLYILIVVILVIVILQKKKDPESKTIKEEKGSNDVENTKAGNYCYLEDRSSDDGPDVTLDLYPFRSFYSSIEEAKKSIEMYKKLNNAYVVETLD